MSEREAPSVYAEDEISLVDLIKILVRRKALIALVFAVCVLAGLAYAFLATPRYEVEVHVDKPFASELAALNVGRNGPTGLGPFSPEQVFGYFTNLLMSDVALQQFFRDVYLPSLDERERARSEEQLYEKMERAIKAIKPDAKGRNLFTLKVEADTGEKAARYTSAFLDLVARDAADKLVGDARNEIDLIVRNTERDLGEIRATAAKQRQDRMIQLSEALQVAEAVGVKEPQVTSGRLPAQDRLTPFMDGTQLYARGTKSLAAELGVLKAREGDDAFIAGLREAESRLRMLKAIELDPKTFKVFNVDGDIVVPEKPVAPKKSLVLVLAAVLGLLGGVTLAFVADFVTKSRREAAA
ncbi:Wzz/FepE/Etk N-terminal domain-containing protein [Aromatoleum petrolei]|uniref:Uncharacterized protein n=1 Tax=Aromatoleum petrolei TaxID=76116 RepID=A0ABX1MX05_9RHOO|nr:Wzz/FepE/Etk N-terminal domain-containing protein [Aromatoleum petrolei]NMF90629.1 hypothetical protein [Aromatoleum petrolei]QTQ35909.1 Chain length determinant domain-containing protein [Aromatoleum petrolei]